MTLPEGYDSNTRSSENNHPTAKSAAIKLAISVIIAIVLIAFIANFAWRYYTVNDNLAKATANLESEWDQVIANCYSTLPRGSADCDNASIGIVDYCKQNNWVFEHCFDPRLEKYLQIRSGN